MNISFRSSSRRRGRGVVCAVSVTGMALVAAYAADEPKPNSQMIVTPIEEASFVPVDPQRPQGAQMSVLWGDPNTGPSATLLRMNKGVNAMHVHTADYHCVVLEGRCSTGSRGSHRTGRSCSDRAPFGFSRGIQRTRTLA